MPLCIAEQSILLIVDIQEKLTAVMPDKVIRRLRRRTGFLLQAADLLQVPVFMTEQYPKGLGSTETVIQQYLPETTRRYEKTCFSCTDASGLAADLQATGRRQVIMAGMEAHICILQTASSLQEAGYETFVIADAICSRNRENYENSLYRMRHNGITVTDSESVLFEWLRDARHEHFKAISGLVAG